MQDEVDVVDHEIEHDSDIGPAWIERRQPITVDESRRLDERQGGTHRPIEPLDMPGLDQCPALRGDGQQFIRFGERRGQRLLDQQMTPALERRPGHREVRWRRHRNR